MFKKFLCTLTCVLFAALSISAQTYRVYRPLPEDETAPQEKVRINWLNGAGLSVGGVYSTGKIKDGEGYILAKVMSGLELQAWLPLGSRMQAGIAAAELHAVRQQGDFLDKIKRRSILGILTYDITPQTNPTLYIKVGAGYKQYRTKFQLQQHNLSAGGWEGLVGLGVKATLFKGVGLAMEYDFEYEAKRWKNFVLTGPQVRQNIRAKLTYRF